jgi:hypothetical protein
MGKAIVKNAKVPIETEDPNAISYFLRDKPMSIALFKERIRYASDF